MKGAKAYYVKYTMGKNCEERGIAVLAYNIEDAYDKAVFDEIPKVQGTTPYSAWVHSVTYQNGNVKYFNTCDADPTGTHRKD